MSYSATKKAIDTLDAIFKGEACSNTWTNAKGIKFFYEIGRENSDGSITGSIWKFIASGSAIKYSSFKIDSNGKVVRFPQLSKEQRSRAYAAYENNQIQDNYNQPLTVFV